jgi:hypothetical protein
LKLKMIRIPGQRNCLFWLNASLFR